jgi:hypothetical protein
MIHQHHGVWIPLPSKDEAERIARSIGAPARAAVMVKLHCATEMNAETVDLHLDIKSNPLDHLRTVVADQFRKAIAGEFSVMLDETVMHNRDRSIEMQCQLIAILPQMRRSHD